MGNRGSEQGQRGLQTQIDAENFVRSYSNDLASFVRFAWNGEHGDGFADANLDLRRRILAVVLAHPDAAPLDLLRCLFEAETKFAQKAWGVNRDMHILAQALLLRGGTAAALDFLRGKLRSQDTNLECAQVVLPKALAADLASHCRQMLDGPIEDADRILAKHGVEFFSAHASGKT
jgi:hypothetical protein